MTAPAPNPYAWTPESPQPLPLPRRRRAPAFPGVDLLATVSVLSLVSLLGLPLAWLWSRLAPAQLSVKQADGTLAALPAESQHRFDDMALFVLLGLAAGIVAAVGVWFMRQRRGPLALIGLVAGSLVGAWLAMRTGVSFAEGRYADVIAATAQGGVVSAVPTLESRWVIVAQPLAAVLTYGVIAATNGEDDLARRLT